MIGALDPLLAQISQILDPVEVVGGSLLLAVGALALRMVTNAARHEREGSEALEARLHRRIDQLEQDLHDERTRSARLILAYDRERQLRIALETATGTVHAEPAHEIGDDAGVRFRDRLDLEDEIDASQ